jgi:hypothetical protein
VLIYKKRHVVGLKGRRMDDVTLGMESDAKLTRNAYAGFYPRDRRRVPLEFAKFDFPHKEYTPDSGIEAWSDLYISGFVCLRGRSGRT